MRKSDDITRAQCKMKAVGEVARWMWCGNLAAAVIGFAFRRFDAAMLAGITALLGVTAAGLSRKAVLLLADNELAIIEIELESEVDESSTGSDYRRSDRLCA